LAVDRIDSKVHCTDETKIYFDIDTQLLEYMRQVDITPVQTVVLCTCVDVMASCVFGCYMTRGGKKETGQKGQFENGRARNDQL
jgi:hypothetical protein